MDSVYPPTTQDGKGGHDSHDVTSWVSVCSKGLWKVQRRRTNKGGRQSTFTAAWSSSDYPRMGSLCQVRVYLKEKQNDAETLIIAEEDEELSVKSKQPITEIIEVHSTSAQHSQDSVLHVPLGEWTILRLGDGHCDITEACVEGMRAEEKCEILLSPLGSGPEPQPIWEGHALRATVELHSFTPGKEFWEMSPDEKWEWVRSHKERGGVRFRSGDVWGSADSYSRALKLLITLHIHTIEANVKGEDETYKKLTESLVPSANEYKTIKAELHSNLSLCQLKLKQLERAKASATKATQLEPSGAKAWYRLGQACQLMNELEEARKAFRRLLELQPDSPAALKALKDVESREKETNSQLRQRLSKMFS
ncbi:peptidyl-prolyl cis-trans isomerase FKBP5 isoform X2 [Lampris incognitus]|uniref:peptidyl-prolyl cis-trans isomerase FKBP5 isoform X2 n=1 Tax=Lampris incognitus TaxID=2546036 RepID=UPI0024B5A3F1|nr:peptidyl-prolyl cis-trans isomerase FKBP5 isoform X2 [Lampris incognitus]